MTIPRSKRQRLRRKAAHRCLHEKTAPCAYCGRKLTPLTATVDHVVPLGRGGTNDRRNLAICCKGCGMRKADWLPCELAAWAERIVALANGGA